MEIIGTVYTLKAVANRLGKSKAALKQAIFRLAQKNEPLIIGDFQFVLVGDNGYIGVKKGEDIVVIDD